MYVYINVIHFQNKTSGNKKKLVTKKNGSLKVKLVQM